MCSTSANCSVRVAKGGRQRVVPIHPGLVPLSLNTLDTRLPLDERALFVGVQGRRLPQTILTQTFLRYARAAGVNTRNRITPHTLRMSTRPSYRTAGRTCARSRSSSGTSTWTRLDTALHARHRARAARCGEAPAVGESFRVTNRAAPPLTSGKKRRRECATSRD